MTSIVLNISGGEIFIILIFILIFFGADKIPEFMRILNKGAREFKKASDDIKREFTDNTSGVLNDLRSIQSDLTESLTKGIAEPVQKSVSEAEKTFDEYSEQMDYYYQNPGDMGNSGNEYKNEAPSSLPESTVESATDTSGNPADDIQTVSATETPNPKPKTRTKKTTATPKPKTKKPKIEK